MVVNEISIEALTESVGRPEPGVADEGGGIVARVLEHFGQGMRFVRQGIGRFAIDPAALIADAVGLRVQAAQKRGHRRLRPRRGREGVVEARRFERQPIEVRRDIAFESVDTEVVVTEGVDDDQDRGRPVGRRHGSVWDKLWGAPHGGHAIRPHRNVELAASRERFEVERRGFTRPRCQVHARVVRLVVLVHPERAPENGHGHILGNDPHAKVDASALCALGRRQGDRELQRRIVRNIDVEAELRRKRRCNRLSRIAGDLDERSIHLNELHERYRRITAAPGKDRGHDENEQRAGAV